MEQVENHMVVDEYWDELEYGISSKARLKRERIAYALAEMEDFENEFVSD